MIKGALGAQGCQQTAVLHVQLLSSAKYNWLSLLYREHRLVRIHLHQSSQNPVVFTICSWMIAQSGHRITVYTKGSLLQKWLEANTSQGSCSGATLFFAVVSAPYATSCLTTSACPSLAAHIRGESPCKYDTASIHMMHYLSQATSAGCCSIQQQGSSNNTRQGLCGAALRIQLHTAVCKHTHMHKAKQISH